MSTIQIQKEKLKLINKHLKPSEVLREAEHRFVKVTGAMCKPLDAEGKKQGYCAMGVLAFEKGARYDPSLNVNKNNFRHAYYEMYLNGSQIFTSGVFSLYGINDTALSSKVFEMNDHDFSFTEIANLLEGMGY